MSEYWKSTPNYWCKFCKTYVRDTPLERRNHEASGKHQGNIQRSLRELHKGAEATARNQQRAKDEIARLNGLVSGNRGTQVKDGGKILGVHNLGAAAPAAPAVQLSAVAQRKAHAEQLAALGVELPPELKKEVTGIGGWHTLSETVIGLGTSEHSGERTLASIKNDEEDVKRGTAHLAESGRKRSASDAAPDDGDNNDEDAPPTATRRVWGSAVKTYPGKNETTADTGDLEALLGGLKPKTNLTSKQENTISSEPIKAEEPQTETPEQAIKPELDAPSNDDSILASVPPAVVFKKRKMKG